MTLFHIDHIPGPMAASKAIEHMATGGVWLIWCAGDEGFLMAQSGSPRAALVRKHWASEIVGEYTAMVEHDELVEAMKHARNAQRAGERGLGKWYLSPEANHAKLQRRRARYRAKRLAA